MRSIIGPVLNHLERHAGAALLVLLMLFAARPANAQNDRIRDTPTGWAYLYGAGAADINGLIDDGFRPFGFKRIAAGEYDTVFVANSGAYAVTGAEFTLGRSPTFITNWLADNNLRLLDVEAYDSNGSTFMSAIAVPNSGPTAAPGWGWVANVSFQQVADWLEDNDHLRLIDLDLYTIGGNQYYSAVAVPNSGNNAQGWWWYSGVTQAQIEGLLEDNDARLVDISLVSAGSISPPRGATFACIMVSSNQGGQWFDTNLTTDEVGLLANQNAARLTCLERYTNLSGQTRWAAVLVDNGDPQTRRIRDYINAETNGITGFMLKRVGGPVLAAANQGFAFEPASMLKILHAAYAIRECSQGDDSLGSDVFIRDRCNNNECPDSVQCNPGNEDLDDAIREMMEQSDNNRTMEIELRYSRATLNAFAASLGLTSTDINHRMGCLCGNPFNSFSCVDATGLYEQIADGSLFPQAWQDTLNTLMFDLEEQGYGGYQTLDGVIDDEAAATDLTADEIAAFRGLLRFANKGGGYACNGVFYRTEGGWASLPFKVQIGGGHLIVAREYVLAAFVHGSTDSSGSQVVYRAKEEMLREQIREALESWDDACLPPAIINQPDDVTVTEGETAEFGVVALGTAQGRTYQWQRRLSGLLWLNLVDIPGELDGTDTATLRVLDAEPDDANDYRCRITNGCGNATSLVATLTVTTGEPCPQDWDGNGEVNSNDYFAFLTDFFAGRADFNDDGVTNSDDYFAFLSAFFTGCP